MDREMELQREKEQYGNVYSEIMFTLNDIEGLEEDTTLKSRFYYRASPLLKKYLDMIDDVNFESTKKVGFFERGKQKKVVEQKYYDLMTFKNDNSKDLKRLANCVNCKCLKCLAHCNFNPCSRCMEAGSVKSCNREDQNLIKFEKLSEEQYNYDAQQYETIDILSEIIVNDSRYRMIYDRGEKRNFILNFDYSMNDGNIYEAVADDDENLDTVIELFESNKY